MFCKYPMELSKKKSTPFGCGDCLPCRINRRRIWTSRLLLEARLHSDVSFLTLTYHDDYLPSTVQVDEVKGKIYAPFSLDPEHHRLFMMNFRNRLRRELGREVRFYMCGEYGDTTQRPHFHYILYGYPPCPYPVQPGSRFRQCRCSVCQLIHSAWGKGNILLGTFSSDSAQYVAGYVMKKMTSDKCNCKAPDILGHKPKCNFYVLKGRRPEFSLGSRRPGIGAGVEDLVFDALQRHYHGDKDELPSVLIINGKKMPLGRYIKDRLYKKFGVEFQNGEKIKEYEKALRDMLLHQEDVAEDVRIAAASGSISTALSLLNSQRVLNLESKFKLYKEKSL